MEKSKCASCGYEWDTGKSGVHSCLKNIKDRITILKNTYKKSHEKFSELKIKYFNNDLMFERYAVMEIEYNIFVVRLDKILNH